MTNFYYIMTLSNVYGSNVYGSNVYGSNVYSLLTSSSLLLRMPRTRSVRLLSNILSRFPLTFLRAIAKFSKDSQICNESPSNFQPKRFQKQTQFCSL